MVQLTTGEITDTVIRGGVAIEKHDAETDTAVPQGDASLAGARYIIVNANEHPVLVDGVSHAKDQTVAELVTDAAGKAQTAADALPYGSYYLQETQAPEGYLLNDTKIPFSVTADGVLVQLTAGEVEDTVKKQAFSIIKISSNGSTGLTQLVKGAGFTVKLKSEVEAAGWDNAATYDVLATDDAGYACSKELPYGTYTVRETVTPDNMGTCPDFEVVIDTDSRTPQVWRALNDAPFEAYVRRTAKQWMVLILCITGIVCGTKPVWDFITGHFGVPFIQFPVRYMPYVMAVLIILLLSRENNRRVQAASLLYAVLYQISYVMLLGYLLFGTSPPDAGGLEGMKRYDSYYVGNGEYVSDFCLSPEEFGQTISHVADEGGNYYAYVREKDRLVVSIDKQKEDIKIQIPKIYYHGYKAVMDDGGSHQELACTKGYSSLINVTVPAGSGGLLSVYYEHPPWLIALNAVCIFVTCLAFIRYINHQLRRKNNLCGKRKDCGC